jgi:hypothetical protein
MGLASANESGHVIGCPQIMRRILGIACGILLVACGQTHLGQLEERQRMFDLRAALEQPGWDRVILT